MFLRKAFVLSTVFGLGGVASAATITLSSNPGDTAGDLFDVSTGATVTAVTPGIIGTGSANTLASDIIGGENAGNVEGAGHIVFSDGSATDTLTFTTPSSVSISGYQIWLDEDNNQTGNRSATSFSLAVNGNTVSTVPIISPGSSYTSTYGSDFIKITDSFAPISGSTFTLSFNTNNNQSGVRVYEIDAIAATPLPASAAGGAVLLGVLALLVRRRRRQTI